MVDLDNDPEHVDDVEEPTNELVVVVLQLLLGVPAVAIVCHLGSWSSKVTSALGRCSRKTVRVLVQTEIMLAIMIGFLALMTI